MTTRKRPSNASSTSFSTNTVQPVESKPQEVESVVEEKIKEEVQEYTTPEKVEEPAKEVVSSYKKELTPPLKHVVEKTPKHSPKFSAFK